MLFDVCFSKSCSTINILTETSRLSELNCASEMERTRICRSRSQEGAKGPIRIVFELEKLECVQRERDVEKKGCMTH